MSYLISKRNQYGFTLIESIMVIVLVMIIGTTAITLFSGQKIFTERFVTDEVKQMIYYARKTAMTTECDVKIMYDNRMIMLSQRENCQAGEFTHRLMSNRLLDGKAEYSIQIPKDIDFVAQFPMYVNKAGAVYDDQNKRIEKIIWKINKKKLNIDPQSGFVYEAK